MRGRRSRREVRDCAMPWLCPRQQSDYNRALGMPLSVAACGRSGAVNSGCGLAAASVLAGSGKVKPVGCPLVAAGIGRIMPAVRNERVAVLLATFNGERYLSRQLESILAQDHRDWVVFASDDGSTDRTLAILNDFRAKAGSDRLVLLEGPHAGYAANFMSLLHQPSVTGDFYAFCDQDDYWDPDKLSRALEWLTQRPKELAALYCGRTRLIDVEGRPAGYSPLFTREPGFRNALAQSLAGGNTMVMNAAARELTKALPDRLPVASHDWWVYLVVSACGGEVHYDPVPAVGYRQHDANLIGSNAGMRSRLDRLWQMLLGSYQTWNDINLSGLEALDTWLTQDSRRTLALFKSMRGTGFLRRLCSLAHSGIYRQTTAGNLGMVLAVILRRF